MDILDYGIVLQELNDKKEVVSYASASDVGAVCKLPGFKYKITIRSNIIGEITPLSLASLDDGEPDEWRTWVSIHLPPFKSTTLTYKYLEKDVLKMPGILFFKTVLKRYLRDSRLEAARQMHKFELIEDALAWSSNKGK